MISNSNEQEAAELTIADIDLMWCERYLLAYLELLKNPVDSEDHWQELSFTEGGADLNPIDILARSLVTSIVISYSRPWSNNRNSGGQPSRLPKTIFRDMQKVGSERGTNRPLLPFNQDVHRLILNARNKVVAHSDHAEWKVEVTANNYGTNTSTWDPFQYLHEAEARQLLQNTRSLRSELKYKKGKALANFSNSKQANEAHM